MAPTFDRIFEDCACVCASIRAIIENKGVFVPHLVDCAGHQKVPGNTGRNHWGGRCEKRAAESFLLGGEDRELQLMDWGIDNLHAALKSLFSAHDIAEATDVFFEKKLAIVEYRKKDLEGTVGSL